MWAVGRNRNQSAQFPVPFGGLLGIVLALMVGGFDPRTIMAAAPMDAPPAPISFRNDVMAVLSKAGCNLGTCHGNARGKGGFQLSLRGQDPENDFRVLTHEWLSRRTNAAEPDRSLLLLKPTMQLAHEGGQRFAIGSPEYQILRDWIAAGSPADTTQTPRLLSLDVSPARQILEAPDWSVSLTVRAKFSEGSTRDVNRFAVYEVGAPIVDVSRTGEVRGISAGETVVLVRYLDQQVAVRLAFIPPRPDFIWHGVQPVNAIDHFVFEKLRQQKLQPSELCDDPTFLRRTFFDLIGTLPTAAEARAFAADTTVDKRARLIDDLLNRPEYADWWALKWADMLRVEEKTLDAKGTAVFHAWLRSAMAADKPLDQLVHELIASRGSTYGEPPSNFYRALRDPFARSEAIGQLFLGVRLQCAKCHNHPFDRWTQDDYYAWGNVFARVDYKIVENRRRDDNDSHEFAGEQLVFMKPDGEVPDPRTGEARRPKFLGEDAPEVAVADDRLLKLADWLTSSSNDRFAQTLVNRTWRHLMGRGLVEPVDDFRATNPPTHPELLQALSAEFRSSGFRLKSLLRFIASSRTYQLSSTPNATNADDELNYSHATVRRWNAEQLADAIAAAMSVPMPYRGYPEGMRAQQIAGVGAMFRREGGPLAGDEFMRVTGRPQRLQSCECERTDETTLAQAFQLISSELLNQMSNHPRNRAVQLAENSNLSAATDELFWSCLSRPATAAEQTAIVNLVEQRTDRRAVLQDVLWSLITSNEFLLRR